ncbi:MAG: tRNA (guanosine(46)-N7)-methyltransferase TrmB [Cytophagaceae bacterium]|jgi:tRNA (guanine-N7-)-methyltransferase|nr:tRNA (guanosine(46)-N7)-methyltransferase TrmB [Cytophagaceae bacterium]
MARKKLLRFKFNEEAYNFIQPGKEKYATIKGNWKHHFGNHNPITLEVGCGRAEYTTGLAQQYPDRNFIGIDIKGARLWKGSSLSVELGLHNTAFLRTKLQSLEDFFEPGEVDTIWITFPDPRPKEGDEKLRLPGRRFLSIYKRLMPQGGSVHFKTDNRALFDYTLEVLQDPEWGISELDYTFDLDQSPMLSEHLGIETTYERKFKKVGFKINYLRFKFLPSHNTHDKSIK